MDLHTTYEIIFDLRPVLIHSDSVKSDTAFDTLSRQTIMTAEDPIASATARMDTTELRNNYLRSGLLRDGKIILSITGQDRAVIGGIVPLDEELQLSAPPELRSDTLCERREAGIINIGNDGIITVDGESYTMTHLDCIYIGRGSKEIMLRSASSTKPARFYLVSYTAHAEYPIIKMSQKEIEPVELGSNRQSNHRKIFKYIHPDGMKSCQLVMGFTVLQPGSVWNTMPPHTHDRRSELYCYFNLARDQAVFHFMGQPGETRHLVVRNEEVVLSPSWSIHAGCGTLDYSFVWAMGGENQDFDDMDMASINELM